MKYLAIFAFMCTPALAGTAVVSGHGNIVKIESGTTIAKTVEHAPVTAKGGKGNASVNINTRIPRNNPDVALPGLVAGVFTCSGSRTAGASGMGFGLGVGGTHKDKDCELRANAATLVGMGYREPARQLMCQNPAVRKAFEDAGQSCDKPLPKPVAHKHTPTCKH